MKRIITAILVVSLLLLCSNVTLAHTYDHDDDPLFIEADCNLPYNNVTVDGSFSYGLGFRFWGIFYFSGMFSENPNFLTCGTGMKIPLGGFGLVWEWGTGYSVSDSGAIYDFCKSYKIGLELDLSDSLGLQVYKKYLTDFAWESGMGGETADFVGAGIVINF